MNAVEAMAKAYEEEKYRWQLSQNPVNKRYEVLRREGNACDGIFDHENRDKAAEILHREWTRAAMRAALIALAQAEIDDEILDTCGLVYSSASGHTDIRHNLECILRALAEQP